MAGRDPQRSFREYDRAYPIRLRVHIGHTNYTQVQAWLKERSEALFGSSRFQYVMGAGGDLHLRRAELAIAFLSECKDLAPVKPLAPNEFVKGDGAS